MATLTETSYYARKGVNILIIVVVLLIVARVLFTAALGIKDRVFPTPPPPANNALGQLPYPNFEGSFATPSGTTYTIETVDGTLPAMPATVKVYSLVPGIKVSFGTLDRMKQQAASMGFTGEPTRKSGTVYVFTDPTNSLRTLEIDELNGDFQIIYNYASNTDVFSQKDFKSKDQVVGIARGFFEDQGLITDDLATGSAQVTYMRLDGQNLVPTTSLANADAVYVSFERAPIDATEISEGTPVVYPNDQKGLVSALVTGNSNSKDAILEARYYHSSIDPNATGTYKPITTAEAFEMLKKGQAIFGSLPTPMPASIPIRSVSLGYLDPYLPQGYLQPVIVFSDDRGFLAYVPAITQDWFRKD